MMFSNNHNEEQKVIIDLTGDDSDEDMNVDEKRWIDSSDYFSMENIAMVWYTIFNMLCKYSLEPDVLFFFSKNRETWGYCYPWTRRSKNPRLTSKVFWFWFWVWVFGLLCIFFLFLYPDYQKSAAHRAMNSKHGFLLAFDTVAFCLYS